MKKQYSMQALVEVSVERGETYFCPECHHVIVLYGITGSGTLIVDGDLTMLDGPCTIDTLVVHGDLVAHKGVKVAVPHLKVSGGLYVGISDAEEEEDETSLKPGGTD